MRSIGLLRFTLRFGNYYINYNSIFKLTLLSILIYGIKEISTSRWRPANYTHVHFDGYPDNLIASNHSILLANKGNIHRFDLNLNHLNSSNQLVESSATNKILLLIDKPYSNRGVFTCWGLQNGTLQCYFNKLDDLNTSIHLNLNNSYKTDNTNLIKGTSLPGKRLLLMTSQLPPVADNSSNQSGEFLPSLGRYKISPRRNSDPDPKIELQQESVLIYKSSPKLYFDYIYSFKHEDYHYFLLQDIQKIRSDLYSKVKLARVCSNDSELISYTEISLSCDNQENLKPTAAFFSNPPVPDQSGETLSGLIIAFQTVPNGQNFKFNELRFICTYSISLLEDKFNEAVRECNRENNQLSGLLSKFDRQEGHIYCQTNTNQDWCKSKTNPYIDGTKIPVQNDHIITHNPLLNVIFLQVLHQGSKDRPVLFIGSTSGLLMKLDDDGQELLTVDLKQRLVNDDGINDKELFQDNRNQNASTSVAHYSINNNDIYANIENTLHKIETQSCKLYSCRGCLRHHDPLGCGWCGNVCKQKSDNCEGGFVSSCQPIIHSFEPTTGVQSSKTRFKILGDNFGSPKADLNVMIGTRKCEIDRAQSDYYVIECVIPAIEELIDLPVYVQVSDNSSDVDIEGNVTSEYMFAIRQLPVLENVQPNYITWIAAIIAFIFIILALILIKKKFGQNLNTKESRELNILKMGDEKDVKTSLKLEDGAPLPFSQSVNQPLINEFLDEDTLKLVVEGDIYINSNRITLTHPIGSGQFGRVFKGFLKDEDGQIRKVAIKTLHSRSVWEGFDCKSFVKEGLIMSDFDHPNVLSLIGLTFDSNGLPMVITPYMHYGDLRSYISDDSSSPTVKELIDYGTQIAQGMAYLSELKFVHRDLAARNCMLDDNLVVKVADFGLSRDIYQRDYYYDSNKQTKLPVKWMALESLERCIYTTKTDVWSYGVLLWELITRGVTPYPDVDNYDMRIYLKSGRRMLRPRYCPILLYKIMLSCWNEDPEKRPTFSQLVGSVSNVITELMVAKDGHETVGKDKTYADAPKYQPSISEHDEI